MNVVRRWVVPMYPNETQEERLEQLRLLHCEVYNAALEERMLAAGMRPFQKTIRGRLRTFWRKDQNRTPVYLSGYDQQKHRKTLRASGMSLGVSSGALGATIMRLDAAYKRVFKQSAGWPKFQSHRQWASWEYTAGKADDSFKGNGWRISWRDERNGSVYLTDVCKKGQAIPFRGCEMPERVRNVGIIKKRGRWYLQIIGDRPVKSREDSRIAAIDFGVNPLATIVYDDGEVRTVEAPKFLKDAEQKLKKAQRELSRKDKFSNNWRKQSDSVGRIHAVVAQKRKEFAHQFAAELATECRVVVTEQLNIAGMSRNGGSRKKGLNRAIADASMGMLKTMVQWKVEERGGEYIELNTRELKPTQRCHACWEAKKKTLSERVHSCSCGVTCNRDVNAALVMLKGWEIMRHGSHAPRQIDGSKKYAGQINLF